MAILVEVPEAAIKLVYLDPNAHKRATVDLTNIAFYHLLRSGEYTKLIKLKRNRQMFRATRMVQFQVFDIGFWRDNKILSRHLPLDMLIQTDSAKMKISNKKMGEQVKPYTRNPLEPMGLWLPLLAGSITSSEMVVPKTSSSAMSTTRMSGLRYTVQRLLAQ